MNNSAHEGWLLVSETTERRGTCNQRQVACFATLFLFCKVKPELLVQHVPTVQPYLEIKCIVSMTAVITMPQNMIYDAVMCTTPV